jgi:hypothetical protein
LGGHGWRVSTVARVKLLVLLCIPVLLCTPPVLVLCDSELRADIKRTALQDSGISQALLVSCIERRLAGVTLLSGLLTRPRATNVARSVQLRNHSDVAWALSDPGWQQSSPRAAWARQCVCNQTQALFRACGHLLPMALVGCRLPGLGVQESCRLVVTAAFSTQLRKCSDVAWVLSEPGLQQSSPGAA